MSEHSGTTPHILCINHEYPPVGGGAATATLHVARQLARNGARVTVLTGRHGNLRERERTDGVNVWRIAALRRHTDKSNPLEMLTFMLSACWWVLRHGRDARATACIAFFGLPAGPAAWLLRVLYGVPYVVSLRGGDVPGFLPDQLGRWHSLTGWLLHRLWDKACAVVANSEGLADLARSSGRNILVIPNGVDAETFAPLGHTRTQSTETHLLHVGRLNKQKSLDTLLYALPRLHGGWRLSLVGDGPEAVPLYELAQSLGVADRVEFLGWRSRDELVALYNAADLFVFPSVDEGMPNAVLEAMSCGLPVVACAVNGCTELVQPDRTGLLVPPRNVEVLAEALQRLCDTPEERCGMGKAGRELAQTHFSWNATAAAYARLCVAGEHTPC